MSEAELDAIRLRCQKALPGPWLRDAVGSDGSWEVFSGYDPIYGVEVCCRAGKADGREQENRDTATFIAHARTDIPKLLDALTASLAREGEMWRVLWTYQWAFHNYSGFKCPCCNKAKSYGHDEGCAIKAALASPAPSSGEEKSHGSSAARPQSPAKCAEAEKEIWRGIDTAPKDRTSVLLALKNPIVVLGRTDLESLNGIQFVGRHPGLCDDGFDIGWNFAAPVGYGGIPDAWIAGWQPLPEPPAPLSTEARCSGDGGRAADEQK